MLLPLLPLATMTETEKEVMHEAVKRRAKTDCASKEVSGYIRGATAAKTETETEEVSA